MQLKNFITKSGEIFQVSGFIANKKLELEFAEEYIFFADSVDL